MSEAPANDLKNYVKITIATTTIINLINLMLANWLSSISATTTNLDYTLPGPCWLGSRGFQYRGKWCSYPTVSKSKENLDVSYWLWFRSEPSWADTSYLRSEPVLDSQPWTHSWKLSPFLQMKDIGAIRGDLDDLMNPLALTSSIAWSFISVCSGSLDVKSRENTSAKSTHCRRPL